MTAPRRIVVGVDGSAPSARAVEWAASLAAALHGEVLAVHALGLLSHRPPVAVGGHATEVDRRAEADAELDTWCEPLRRAGVAHRHLVVDGTPALALLAAAADERADLIVVGPRGKGAGSDQQLGSTSHELVSRSPVPVVVVPASP